MNKAIKITVDNLKELEKMSYDNDKKNLNFCYFAESRSSFSVKVYFLENFKKYQALNVMYPGIGISDIIPKNSFKKYRLELFNIMEDIFVSMTQTYGKSKLYLYMAKPEEEENYFEKHFAILKNNGKVLETQAISDTSTIYFTKEKNKCLRNQYTGKYECILSAIVQCIDKEDCIYDIFFDLHICNPKKYIQMSYRNMKRIYIR